MPVDDFSDDVEVAGVGRRLANDMQDDLPHGVGRAESLRPRLGRGLQVEPCQDGVASSAFARVEGEDVGVTWHRPGPARMAVEVSPRRRVVSDDR